MKRRILSLLLALSLVLTVPALAAETGPVRTKTYSGQFSDVAAGSTFYENVAALYEYGLTVGKADGTFGPQDSVTVGQAVIFAARARSLYLTGNGETDPAAYAGDGISAAEQYLRYLKAEGVLGTELDGQLGKPATRAQVAHVLALTLPSGTLPLINDAAVTQGYASRRYITDVTEYTPYYQEILYLYRTGLSQGSGESAAFSPDATITRGALAAMLTRLVDPNLRIALDWDTGSSYPSAAGTTLASLVGSGTYIATPANRDETEQSVRYMLASGKNTLTLQYDGLTAIRARQVMEEALAIVKTYCEQCYNTVSCTYTTDGALTLTFSAASAGENLSSYRAQAMAAAIAVHDQLWKEGIINARMTQREKARAYYTWICDNCVYDYSATDTSLSHIAYNLFINGAAVCDGYTGAYNMLLKLEGISCTALSNAEHIWTVAVLDGTQVHIDTTWGDSGSVINYDYFAMTPTQSWNVHPW